MSKKVLEISQSEYISYFLNSLIVKSEEKRIIVPISQIDTVLVSNPRCNISVPLLNELVAQNVNIIICDSKFKPTVQISPIQGYYSNKNFLNQINWGKDFKGFIWREIIKTKIVNYTKLIYYLDITSEEEIDKLIKYYESVLINDRSNCEGHAAKLSFKILYGSSFSRDDENIINTFLDYGYTVLMTYVSRSIIKNGLDNRIGIFHKSFNNHFALSCDLMEPLRALIDKLVYTHIYIYGKKDFILFKKDLFCMFEEKIAIKNTKLSVNEYIDKIVKSVINNNLICEDFIIEWS
nr:type II CRISPR-associated endonuclease Cas1 [Mycoplasmopsis canis]WQQ12208.1 type II CRISPR-associated endonuclease Cas1 [Mycoplasmopsis canis]